MTKIYTLKSQQDEKEDINKVEVEVEITEETTRTEPTSLEVIDQEIFNLDERISKLQTQKAEKEADRVKIDIEAKKATLKVVAK